ncbi:Glyoxalase/Bleomycin resistance protein/Dihydroxybiphenyl dioxygenase [Hyaloraphidium curvatum]|nr:Glyoxalase/Bleomycin resistance protein/Dihydroxybiphenyl dioxygenase [Hyaloraphidium curvatum]
MSAAAASPSVPPFSPRIASSTSVSVSPAGAILPADAPGSRPATMIRGANYLGEEFVTVRFEAPSADTAAEGPEPVGIESVNHIAFDSREIEKTAAFYVNVLGFTRIPRPQFPFPGAWLLHGNLMVHLFPPDPEFFPDTPAPPSPHTAPESEFDPRSLRRGRHIAFQVRDIDAAEERLRMWGVSYTRFGLPKSKAVQIFFRDPEGRPLEIGTYLPFEGKL